VFQGVVNDGNNKWCPLPGHQASSCLNTTSWDYERTGLEPPVEKMSTLWRDVKELE